MFIPKKFYNFAIVTSYYIASFRELFIDIYCFSSLSLSLHYVHDGDCFEFGFRLADLGFNTFLWLVGRAMMDIDWW